jgi:predicted alpha/beta-hydrolase family hydrolase
MASMAVAEGLPAAAVLLISYPLHPPGRPDRPRCAHLGQLSVPTLWLSGSRDAFATPEEVKAASRLTVGPASVVVLEGADHGLRGRDIEVAAAVVTWWEAVMGRRTPRG